MINVIKDDINIIFKKYDYPELFLTIGIDSGENAIVQYGYEKDSPIDIIGYSMNIVASKILLYRMQTKYLLANMYTKIWILKHKGNFTRCSYLIVVGNTLTMGQTDLTKYIL